MTMSALKAISDVKCYAIALLFMITMLLYGCSDNQNFQDAQFNAEWLTKGEFCSRSEPNIANEYVTARLNVSAYPLRCAIWPSTMPSTLIMSGKADLAGYEAPLLVFFKNDQNPDKLRSPRKVLIRVPGGPGVPIGPYGHEEIYMNSIGTADILISVGYLGTSHGSLYPSDNFALASKQVATLVERIHEKTPKSEIYLIGESLGGPIVIGSLTKISKTINVNTILIVPMVASPIEQLRYLIDTKQTGLVSSYKIVRPLINRKNKIIGERVVKIDSVSLFKSFFDKSEQDVGLYERIRSANIEEKKLLIIFGSKDTVIGSQSMHEFGQHLPSRVVNIDGMGHELGEVYRAKVEKEITKFIAGVN